MIAGQLEIQLMANIARLKDDMSKAQNVVSNTVSNINKVLGAIGVGISADFLLGLTKNSMEYSKSLAALSTQLGNATDKVKELDVASRSLSMQFGTTAAKQSAAFYEILSAGITDTIEATELLTEANRLAVGGAADLMVSIDGLTSIIKGYGSAAGTAAQISDTLFTASLAGKISIQELSEGIGKVVPLSVAMGISLEEVTAAIASLTLGGISAKESITGVRAVLAAVAKPSSQAATLAKQIGLEFNTAGVQARGFSGFLDEVKRATGGSADQLAILFGGVESLVPALALTGNAGVEFNGIMDQMAVKTGAAEEAFNKMAESPGFKVDRLMAAINSIALTLGDTLANYLAPAAEKAARFLSDLFGAKNLSEIDKQREIVNKLTADLAAMNDRKNVPVIGDLLFDKRQADLLEQRLSDAVNDLKRLESATVKSTSAIAQQAPAIAKANIELEKKSNITKKQVSESDKLAKIEDRRLEQLMVEGARLTESIDPLVKRNNEIARYKTLLESGAISEGIYSQAVERSTEDYLKALGFVEREIESIDSSTKKLKTTSVQVFDSMEQIAIQGARNIQSSFADGIFNFFDNGLKGMVNSVVTAVGRIASEFASIKLLQAAGGLFGIGGASTAFASGGGGLGTGLSLASLGSSAANLFKTGFGATGLLGGGLSALGGSSSLGMFGAGMQGGSAGAAFIAAESATGAGTAGLGASMGAVAGPLIALAVADQIGRLLAGDKSTGTFVDKIPVIGGFAGALFGRGPYKFREQQILGNVSAGGFDGEVADVYKSKGGLFLGNKHRRQGAENESEIIALFDSAIQGFAQSARSFADTLGLDASAIDDYNKKIFIRSQKGQQLSEEIVNEMIASIGNDFARRLIPEIDEFSRSGESAMSTLQRLSDEFNVLVSSATLLGRSVAEARDLISKASIEGRSAFVEMAGGVDALSQKAAFFAENFLTDSERLQPSVEILGEEMARLGLSADMSKEQFKLLVQSFGQVNGISEEMLVSLLDIAPLFVQVKNGIDSLGTSLRQFDPGTLLGTAFSNLERSVSAERERITIAYNKQIDTTRARISSLSEAVNKLRSLSDGIRTAVDNIRGMSTSTARQQLQDALQQAGLGIMPDLNKIQPALQALQNQSASGFSSREAMIKERASNAKLVDSLGDLVDEQLYATQKMLTASEGQLNALQFGFSQEMSRLDGILSNGREQVDQLMGINTSILSLTDALLSLNAARGAVVNAGAGVTAPSSVLGGAGNPNITDRDILDYVSQVGGDPDKILNAAIQYGVSAAQYSAATGTSLDEIRTFAASRGITGFASGGSFKGGVRIVGEYGPEIERTGPSKIYSNSDSKEIFDSDGIKEAINRLADVVAVGNKEQRRNADILDRVTLGGTSFRTVTA